MSKATSRILVFLFCLMASNGAVARDYLITDFRAVADTSQLSTQAIQSAIDACAAAGGGRVVVPAGHFKTGSIVLKSHVNLHLENGAVLYGSTRLEDYRKM